MNFNNLVARTRNWKPTLQHLSLAGGVALAAGAALALPGWQPSHTAKATTLRDHGEYSGSAVRGGDFVLYIVDDGAEAEQVELAERYAADLSIAGFLTPHPYLIINAGAPDGERLVNHTLAASSELYLGRVRVIDLRD